MPGGMLLKEKKNKKEKKNLGKRPSVNHAGGDTVYGDSLGQQFHGHGGSETLERELENKNRS